MPEGVNATYRQIAKAIENKADLTTLLADSFQYLPFEGRALDRTDWLATWGRNFRDVAYTAASYQVRSPAAIPGGWRVVAERTLFFRLPGAGQESVQVCRTADEWLARDGRWLLRSQRELAFPEDGEVPAPAPPPASARLRRLVEEFKADGETAVDALVGELRGRGPLVEKIDSDPGRRLVTFLYRGDPSVLGVAMAGGPYRDGPRTLSRHDAADLWYRSELIPSDARFVYFLTVTRRSRKVRADGTAEEVIVTLSTNDPLNPITFNGGSVVWPADVPPPGSSAERMRKLRGRLQSHTLRSTALGEERSFSVYTAAPPDAAPQDAAPAGRSSRSPARSGTTPRPGETGGWRAGTPRPTDGRSSSGWRSAPSSHPRWSRTTDGSTTCSGRRAIRCDIGSTTAGTTS